MPSNKKLLRRGFDEERVGGSKNVVQLHVHQRQEERRFRFDRLQNGIHMHAQNDNVVIFSAVRFIWVERVVLLLIVGDALAIAGESDVVLLACLRVNVWPDLFDSGENPLLDLFHIRHVEDVHFKVEWLWKLDPAVVLFGSIHYFDGLDYSLGNDWRDHNISNYERCDDENYTDHWSN